MAIYYIDYVNGLDANNGSSWALAWKTINGAVAATIGPGDVIRIAKSPAPTSLGITAQWTGVPATLPTSLPITSSTNAGPINVNCVGHGYVTGDIIYIQDHTVNLTANGTWTITYVGVDNFTLDGSTGIGVGGATGTCTKIPWLTVKLTSALTKTITRAEQVWTVANTSTVTLDTAQFKEGDASVKIVKAAPANSTLYAYFQIGGGAGVNFSAYQTVSFWIYNATAILAGQWNLCLCSDTAGAVVVDTIPITAIPCTTFWTALNIARTGGGNLGASIQSVALYSGATAGATTGIYLDNIVACTTSGLNLQSLISKNTLAQGSMSATGYANEGWYAIQSISEDGKCLRIDSSPTFAIANYRITANGAGYSGATETVTTYKRETIKTNLVATQTTVVQQIQDSGTPGNNIQYQGGYDTGTTTQNGETFYDGLNNAGYGLQFSSTNSYNTINYLNFYKYSSGLYFYTSSNNTVTTCTCAMSNDVGIYLYNSSYNNTFGTVVNINNNGSYGITFNPSTNNIFNNVYSINNNGRGLNVSGVVGGGSNSNIFYNLGHISNNNNYAVIFSSGSAENKFWGPGEFSNNTTACIGSNSGLNYFNNFTMSGTEFSGALPFANGRIYSTNHDGTLGNHYIFTDYGVIVSDSGADRHTASGICWKLSPTDTSRSINYPLELKVATIACVAGTLVTVKAWIKKSHATDIAAQLICRGRQIAGVDSDVIATKASDTSYEQLTITFTPTVAGVVDIIVIAYWVANAATQSVWVDDMTITQV